MAAARGWGEERSWGKLLCNGYKVSVWEDEKVLETDCTTG